MIKIEVNVEELFEDLCGESFNELIREHFQREVIKKLKRDKRYKDFIEKKTIEFLGNLKV